jgi:choline dehydrogenase-like flavoprotein
MSAGQILDASTAAVPDALTVDVCIVGSGCGGATAAWELARAGREVLVLEEGGDFTGTRLTQRDAEMYDQLYMDRGGRATTDLSVSVLQGRVLGGGGVINASDVVPLSDEVLLHWQKAWGLTDFSPATLAPFRDAALADLHANRPSDAQVNANNQALRRGAEALGWKGEVMLHNREGCAGVGACLIGCPLDRKKNPRFVAIPAALEAGARFLTRVRAVKLEGASSELKVLHARRLDARGYKEGAPLTVRARTVILAANAVASAQLLLRSGVGNAHVGRHLMLQPQQPVVARFAEPVRFFRGIPQSFAVTEFERPATEREGWWGFRIEGISGTPGIVASLLPEVGAKGKALMQDYHRLAASLLLTPDRGQGTVRVEGSGRLRIEYALDEEQRARLREAVVAAAKLYLAAGATEVLVPNSPPLRFRSEADLKNVASLSLAPTTAPLLSAHQMGTVRFAPNESDGGADPDGQVYGTRGVYVFDSSGFPSSASSHTMAPILTVSRYLSRKLLAKLPA